MPSRNSGAIAVFVKTPGLSPIKTRLAQVVGDANAERFYLLSTEATKSVVMQACEKQSGLTPYWAVAEKEGLRSPLWNDFSKIWQGDGSLGKRLACVYDELIQRHSFVILIGADSPQITSDILCESAVLMSQKKGTVSFVLGRAKDGGFYLFGGAKPIPEKVWLDVPYSVPTTAAELAKRIKPIGRIIELPSLFDIDTVEDMAELLQVSTQDIHLTSEQHALLKWVRGYFTS